LSKQEKYIERCLSIAKNGLGTTRPNPMVGAVIVYNDRIIGEGFTSKYGGPHAEVNALNSVNDKSLLVKSTLYVTLEPCCHFGKTPPCCDLIIKYKIPNVVIGCQDRNPKVFGKGIKKLEDAGINVVVGIMEDQCLKHHKRFFTFHNKKRPYIIIKWAESIDEFIAPESRSKQKPIWLTNAYSRQLVHKWRSEEQSILIGTNTAIQDNPMLTVRSWTGNNPIRIVIDKEEKLMKDLNIFNSEAETIVVSNNNFDFSKPLAIQICNVLFNSRINSLIIEGGAQTIQSFINEDLWDEARVFTAPITLHKGTKSPNFSGSLISEYKIEDDILKIYRNDSHAHI
jgi:diaminohydroxyphosphoribosylaminopyrimidine deaminase/5-amino-6-(5-phosphoribosylamino)uracil reductase